MNSVRAAQDRFIAALKAAGNRHFDRDLALRAIFAELLEFGWDLDTIHDIIAEARAKARWP
jgi:hypothetical protein